MKSNTVRWMAPWALALAAACGSEASNGNGNGNGNDSGMTMVTPEPPTITQFDIEGLPVDSGGMVTLRWAVTDADSIRITRGQTDLGVTEFMGSLMDGPIDNPVDFTLTATNEAGTETAMASIGAEDIRGLRVVSFSADRGLVTSGDVITLSYELAGAAMVDAVEIFDEDMSPLQDGQGVPIDPATLPMAEVEVQVIGDPMQAVEGIETKTFTIRASGGGTTATAEVNVDVEVADPIIVEDSFQVSGNTNTFFFGDRPSYDFETRNADGYQLLFDGVPCTGINSFDETGRVINQSCSPGEVTAAQHTVTLRVFNANRPLQTDPVEESIIVLGTAQPMINSFTVTPEEFWQGSVLAELSWDVSADATRVELGIRRPGQGGGFVTVEGAPTTLQADNVLIEVEAVGTTATEFELRALVEDENGAVVGTQAQQQRRTIEVTPSFNDPEGPDGNDSPSTANIIQANGLPVRGNLSTINDVDWFGFDVQEGQSLFAIAGVSNYDPTGLNVTCGLDTSLQLFDASGAPVSALQTDNSTGVIQDLIDVLAMPPPGANIETECAELRAGRDAGLSALSAGRYYVAVSGSESGNYQLLLERIDPLGTPPNLQPPSAINFPSWEIEDINISQVQTADGGIAIPVIATMLYLHPNHALAPSLVDWFNGRFAGNMSPPATRAAFSGLFGVRRPHVLDYANEVGPGLAILGASTNQMMYPRAAIGEPGMDGDGFLLTYTVVPSSGPNGVEGTAEDYDLASTSSTGPIISENILPFETTVQSLTTALPSTAVIWDENSPGGNDRGAQSYPGFQTTMNDYDGVTHLHFAHLLSRNFFSPMGDPLEVDPAVSTYLLNWQIELVDRDGNGYEFTVPITMR